MWEECVQEEERIISREENLNDNEDQALAVHTKVKNKRNSRDHPHKNQGFNKSKKEFSNYECFTCHKLGHIAINCPMKEERVKNMTRFQARAAEDSDQEVEGEARMMKTPVNNMY